MSDQHKIPQAAPLPPDLVTPDDLKSLPPQQPQPAVDIGEAPPPSLGQRAVLSIRAMADTDIRQLMSSKKGNRWKALGACFAVVAVIGAALFVVGGEGNIKERARANFSGPIAMGEGIAIKLVRDAQELAKIKAELDAPKPDASAVTSAAAKPPPKGAKNPLMKLR